MSGSYCGIKVFRREADVTTARDTVLNTLQKLPFYREGAERLTLCESGANPFSRHAFEHPSIRAITDHVEQALRGISGVEIFGKGGRIYWETIVAREGKKAASGIKNRYPLNVLHASPIPTTHWVCFLALGTLPAVIGIHKVGDHSPRVSADEHLPLMGPIATLSSHPKALTGNSATAGSSKRSASSASSDVFRQVADPGTVVCIRADAYHAFGFETLGEGARDVRLYFTIGTERNPHVVPTPTLLNQDALTYMMNSLQRWEEEIGAMRMEGREAGLPEPISEKGEEEERECIRGAPLEAGNSLDWDFGAGGVLDFGDIATDPIPLTPPAPAKGKGYFFGKGKRPLQEIRRATSKRSKPTVEIPFSWLHDTLSDVILSQEWNPQRRFANVKETTSFRLPSVDCDGIYNGPALSVVAVSSSDS